MKLRLIALVAAVTLCLPFSPVMSQDKSPVKFGKVSPEDFDLSKFKYDTSAGALILADVGSTSFEGNNKGRFTLVFQRKKRIKILNKNGFDAASEEILLYSEGSEEEKLLNLRASTYNLENGSVIQTKLDDGSVFKEKLSKNLVKQKFTLPAVKAGSIIEYSYTINSDYIFNLQPWTFQEGYPSLWSEYQVDFPEFYNYVFISQGYLPFHINKKTTAFRSYNLLIPNDNLGLAPDPVSISGNVYVNRWVIKDIPALKEERFTSTLKNHVAKIDFQLSQIRYPNAPVKDVMKNWVVASEELLKDEEFGAALAKDNNWLNDDMRSIVTRSATQLEKAKQIYTFIRDNFTCTSHSKLRISGSLKSIFSKKSGSVADINLLLVAMLRHEGIVSYPMILSTRDHGLAYELYPLIEKFNYVIAEVLIDEQPYFLDASRQMGFGKLASDCYNGCARVISNNPVPIYLMADSLMEEKITSVFIMNSDKKESMGRFSSQLGFNESENLRTQIKSSGKEAFTKKLVSGYNGEASITNLLLDSLKDLENPVRLQYEFTLDNLKEDVLYFNPLLTEGYRENPFKAAERLYPVEMPYTMNETYLLNMEIPTGYVVDEMPKSAKVQLNDNEGYFEYIIVKDADRVQLRTRVVLKKTNFLPEDYTSLRDFFGYIVKKHGEQIVFKKAK